MHLSLDFKKDQNTSFIWNYLNNLYIRNRSCFSRFSKRIIMKQRCDNVRNTSGERKKQVGASPPTSLSKCQVIGSCRFHFVFFHVSEFKNQWWARKRWRAGGAEEGQGRRHVGPGPFFVGLASIGRRSWRGFACCPGKRTPERSPKGEKEKGEKEGG